MFDEGQGLPSAYHRTKFESERIAREEATVPWRVYRPAIVIGHSQTGAMDQIAHQPGLDGRAFHLMAPKSRRSGEVLNVFADAAHAPRLAMRVDKRLTDALPKGVLSFALKLPALRQARLAILEDLGLPEEILEHVG